LPADGSLGSSERSFEIAFKIAELDRANEQWNSGTIGTQQRRKIMPINDKEYKRKCFQGIPAFTLTTSKCGCCCFVDWFSRGASRRKIRSGMGKCVYLVVNASMTLFNLSTSTVLDEEHQ
jgi:hypothetical protein